MSCWGAHDDGHCRALTRRFVLFARRYRRAGGYSCPLRILQSIVLAAALALLAAIAQPARAQKLEARYAISMTGIRVGQSAWTVKMDAEHYSVAATGGSVDIINVLLRGEGSAEAAGDIKNGHLVPTSFSSSLVEDGQKIDLKMTMEDGVVTAVKDNGPPPGSDRVPLTPAHAQGVIDPLSALLIPNEGSDATLAQESCNRTLAVFDGRRRYDLVLSFKRMETLRGNEYAGRALVCNVILRPIAGHRADSMIMKYVAGRRDMEIFFASIAGTRFLAPVRLLVPTLIGTMAIQATSFEITAAAPAPN
jgi:Protein of unknown function (DUF3108)